MAAGSTGPGSGGAAGDVVGQWRVEVDAHACIGSGVCAAMAPGHFQLTGEHSVPIREVVDPDERVLSAVDLCPAEAIAVRDAGTGAPVS